MRSTLMSGLIVTLFLVIASGTWAETNYIQSASKNIISITCANNILTLNEPLVVVFRVSNPLAEPLSMDLGFNRKEGFQHTLFKSDGSKIHPQKQHRGGIGRTGVIILRPGESYSQSLVINEWYEFSTPGNYALEIQLVNPIKTQQGSSIEISSNFKFDIEIQSRNEEKLIDTCENLSALIRNASSYSEAADPAYILSHVKDKTAIPYLTQLLTLPIMVEHFAIDGLARIGDQEAVNALIFSLKILPRDMVFIAQHALLEIQAKSSDATIKETIRQVMAQ